MRIQFPLMSILSVAVLAFFLVTGGTAELHSIEFGFSADSEGVTLTVDPAFVVWSDVPLFSDARGETFGNTSILQRSIESSIYANYVRHYEVNHIKQYYALGWMIYPLSLFLNIEDYQTTTPNWNDPSQADSFMWIPSSSFYHQWHFLSLSVTAR